MIDFIYLHPMLIHFPIALLIVGFLTDLAGLIIRREIIAQAGFYLLILGALGTIAAFMSGEQAGDGISEQGLLKLAMEQHEEAAELAIWLVSTAAGVRIILVLLKKYSGLLKALAFVLFLVSVLAVARTGYYGGKLVYEYGAGVQINVNSDLSSDFGSGD